MLISSENRGYVYVCETQQKGMSPLELPKKFHDVLHFVLRGQSCKQYCIENHDPVSHVVLILKELRTDSGFVQVVEQEPVSYTLGLQRVVLSTSY
jgi:hypothetical protein